MKSFLSHLQININPDNLNFYKELMSFLGWNNFMGDEGFSAFSDPNNENLSLWFMGGQKSGAQDYDMQGVNHIGIGVSNQSDVDEAAKFLESRGIKSLFETPRHRPDFAEAEDKTYYQVMFESPDKILFEIMYTGDKK